jgi:hypothetical protein
MNVFARDSDQHSLLGAMRHQIAITQMPAPRRVLRAPTVGFAGHPRILAAGAAAAVAAATTAVLAIGAATSAAPAFAVTDNPDGSVSITLNEITGVFELNAKLAAMGIAVRAVPVASGCTATAQVVGPDGSVQPAATLAATPLGTSPRTGSPATLNTITVDPPHTSGQTEILAASTSGLDLLGQVVQGQVPSCVAPAGSASPASGTFPVGGGETTIQLGSH